MDFLGIRRGRLRRSLQKGVSKLLALPVKEGMSEYVVTIAPEKSAVDVATVMVGESVSAIVVERDNKPLGIVTERDFVNKVPLSKTVFKLPATKIMGCMKGEGCPVFRVYPETNVLEAQKLLKEKHIRKLVVTGKEDEIKGILTQTDLCRLAYENIVVIAKTTDVPMYVKDVMTKKIISVKTSSSFAAAKQLMMKNNLTCMPVTEGKEYVGLFTEHDVVMQFYDAGGKLAIKTIPEIMKRPVKVIPANLTIFEANAIMLFEKVRRLLVMDEGKIIGILSQTDLVHGCYQYAVWLADQLKSGRKFTREDMEEVKGKEFIISKYAGPHARMYTVQ